MKLTPTQKKRKIHFSFIKLIMEMLGQLKKLEEGGKINKEVINEFEEKFNNILKEIQ